MKATDYCQKFANEGVNSVKADTCLTVYKYLNWKS